MSRKTCALTAAAALAAVTLIGGVLVISSARQEALAAQQVATSTAQVEQRALSAMVSRSGILTYRAQADGSSYFVINQAHPRHTRRTPLTHASRVVRLAPWLLCAPSDIRGLGASAG